MSDENYFVRWRGKKSGPFDIATLVSHVGSGQLTRHHSLSIDEITWCPAGSIETLFPAPSTIALDTPVARAGMSLMPAAVAPLALSASIEAPLDKWFYTVESGKEVGPVSFDLLRQLAGSGQLKADDQVLKEGAPEWTQARQVSGLVFSRQSIDDIPRKTNPAVTNPHMQFCTVCGQVMARTALACPHCGGSAKYRLDRNAGSGDFGGRLSSTEKAVALLLLFFLGQFGAHRFYLGYPGYGVFYILLWVFIVVVGILGMGMHGLAPNASVLMGFTLIVLCISWLFDFISILTGHLKMRVREGQS